MLGSALFVVFITTVPECFGADTDNALTPCELNTLTSDDSPVTLINEERTENEYVIETIRNETRTTNEKDLQREVHQAHALSSSFEKLAGEGVFIDKSYLIKDMFKVKKKVILLTRPPKWGKTVTLDMIKNFLNVEVNEMGEKQSGNLLLQPKMFHGSNFGNPAVGYKRLKISNSAICKKMCEYPVIYIDLAGIDGFNESEILWSLYDKIDHVFKTQFHLLNETSFMHALSEENDMRLRYERFSERGTVEYGEFKKSLAFLSNILYKVYNSDPVILIDNYDKSLLDLYLKYGPNHEASLALRKALEDFLKKSLKHNPRLRKAFITGVFPCAKYDIMSKIDLVDCNIFTSHFGRDFGLNEYEVFELLGHLPSSKLDQIMDFYLGYSHGNQTRLANPYSIMNVLLSKGAVKPYWPIKEDVKVFNKALRTYFKQDYKTLMSGKAIPDLYLSQRLKLSEVIEPENLLEMLVYNGYLSATPSRTKVLPVRRKSLKNEKNKTMLQTITFHNVAVPNREILTAFHKIIRSEAKRKLREENEQPE